MTESIRPSEFEAAEGLEDWRILADGGFTCFRTGSFAAGVRLAQAIGELRELGPHHPDLDLRHDAVTVRLITITEDSFGMTTRDVELARQITAIAREQGLTADPSGAQALLIVPGAPDTAAIMPFWRAVLGYEPRPDTPDEDLVDPRGRGASFWFEPMDEPRADGGGAIHIAVWVPFEQAQERIDAALAAGGRMVRDEFAPAWWTLADPAGNEADIATSRGRA